MKVYLIRHGETEWNTKRKLQGTTDIPLNENGENLARAVGEALKETPIDMIFTSPLVRAHRTAELIRGERKIPIVPDERLRELCFGDYEGFISTADGYNIPDPNFRLLFTDTAHYPTPPNGESLEALLQRTASFLEELKNREDLKEKTVLLASHGATVRALLTNIEKCGVEHFWGKGVHRNCGVSCVELTDGEYRLLWENRSFTGQW